MNRARLFQIIACFIGVFALGGLSGWLLKPTAPASARLIPGERILTNLDTHLKLTAEQKTNITPILAEWERELMAGPRGPRRRLQLFQKYSARIRQVLAAAQLPTFDKMVEENTQRLGKLAR